MQKSFRAMKRKGQDEYVAHDIKEEIFNYGTT